LNVTSTGGNPSALIIQGDGVADISGNAPTFVVSGALGARGTLQFRNSSTPDDAVITTNAFGQTIFSDNSTGGMARFITNAGGVVDFSGTSGPAGKNIITAGSIEGAGTFNLGANMLIVGLNGLSTTVSGSINDGGASGGTGASLVKVGAGTLTLSGASTYTGLTAVLGGTLQAGAANAFASSSAFTVISGATLDLAGFNQTIGSLAGTGSVTLGSATLTTTNNSTSTSFSGTISGTGGMTKVGAGTLLLTGNNTYTGTTTISAGTLQLGNGGASGSIAGDVVNNGVFAINRSDRFTFGNVISGNGAFQQNGTGATVLTASNTYSGTTTVNAGALFVNGSIASSSLTTVNSGAALLGSGTVGSTVINSRGFLAPGNSPGTMTVAGNLAFQSGAFYVVQLNPTTASTTNVSGTAALAGTVAAIFLPGSYVVRSYTILTAAGGRTGTFDALATVGLPSNFGTSLTYTGNTAVLNLTAQLVPAPRPPTPSLPPIPGLPTLPKEPSAPPLPIFTANQLNVGRAIDDFFNNGGALPPAFAALFNLTGSNLTNALDQLSGEAASGAQQAGFQMESQFLNLMLDPFVDGRSGVGGAAGPALGFAPEREELPDDPRSSSRADIALAYSSVLKAPPARVPSFEQRWTAWGGAYGGGNRTSGDPAVLGSHDLSASTAGFAGGLDYHLTRDSVVGFALAGGGTNWSLAQGLGGGRSDAFQAGVYGATRSGPAYLAAAFAYTNHWMSTDRFAFAGDHLTASFNAQSIGGRVESGYRFATFYGGVAPYAAIQAQSFRTPSYSETDTNGGGFALSYNARTATDTRSELGARFDRLIALYPGAALSLRARLAWAHDWVSDPTLAAVFQTLPGASFIVNGATPAKNSALASAGAEYRLANGVTLLAKFDGEFAAHSSTYAGTGTLRYTW
jgi:outer membrane autotransporter protein